MTSPLMPAAALAADAAAAARRSVLKSRRDALKDLYKLHRVKLVKLYNRTIQAAGKALRKADVIIICRLVEINALEFIGKLSNAHVDEAVGPEARQELLDEIARIDSRRARRTRDPDAVC